MVFPLAFGLGQACGHSPSATTKDYTVRVFRALGVEPRWYTSRNTTPAATFSVPLQSAAVAGLPLCPSDGGRNSIIRATLAKNAHGAAATMLSNLSLTLT